MNINKPSISICCPLLSFPTLNLAPSPPPLPLIPPSPPPPHALPHPPSHYQAGVCSSHSPARTSGPGRKPTDKIGALRGTRGLAVHRFSYPISQGNVRVCVEDSGSRFPDLVMRQGQYGCCEGNRLGQITDGRGVWLDHFRCPTFATEPVRLSLISLDFRLSPQNSWSLGLTDETFSTDTYQLHYV